MFGRDTQWRQGSVLLNSEAVHLGFVEEGVNDRRVVVVSHDCDIPNEKEDQVEVVVGQEVPKLDVNFARARNVRRLHLTYSHLDGNPKYIELNHANRQTVSKARFSTDAEPDPSFEILADEKQALKQWLAARYGRPAFPNAFENRLRTGNLEKPIAKIVEKASSHLIGVFFDLGEDRSVELSDTTPYVLRIALVYDAIDGGSVAREAAESAARDITQLFYTAFGDPSVATEIALEQCSAVADTHLTLSDLRKVDQWRVEYISLRETPPGAHFPIAR